METRRPGKKTAPWAVAVQRVLVGSWLAGAACTGVEADVLSLRPIADLAAGQDAGATTRVDGAAASCTTQLISTQTCVDIAAWLPRAQAICSSLGLVPGPLVFTSPCLMNTAQGVRFECCPMPVCTTHMLGDAMSCRDPKELLDSATLDCQSRGEKASLMALVELCQVRRYRMVKYMCCSGPTPSTMP